MRDEEKIQRQKDFLVNIAFWGVWFLIAFLFLKAVGSILLPFVIAFIVAWLLAKPVNWVTERIRLRRSIVSVVAVLLFYALFGALVYFVGSRLMHLIYDIFYELSDFFSDAVIPALHRFFSWLENLLRVFSPAGPGNLGEDMAKSAPAAAETAVSPVMEEVSMRVETMEKAGKVVSELSGSVISGVSGMAAGIPGVLMNLLITMIATVFMEIEIHSIVGFFQKQIPEKYQKMLLESKDYAAAAIGRCVWSYCLILGITFLELCVGLSLLGIERAAAIALIVSVLDILPVLGTGTVLAPWAVIAFAAGKLSMGAGVLSLYLVVTVVRNIIEPKLVGRQMGLSPVVMLPCMLVGLKFFGIAGLFLLPLGASLLKSLNDKRIISIFRT